MPEAPAPTTAQPQEPQTQSVVNTPPPPTPSTTPEAPKKSSSLFKWLILGGLLLLVGIGGAFYFLVGQKPVEQVPVVTQAETTPAPFDLTLESPADGELIESNMLTIKGKTAPNTVVAFYSETAEGSAESDAQGVFEGVIELEEGINTVTVTAFGKDGEEKSLAIDVVYDTSGGTQ